MAILIVILAPQYLRYVERSRNSTDLQNARQIVDALMIYAADPNVDDPIPTQGDLGDVTGWQTVTVYSRQGSGGLYLPGQPDGYVRVDAYAARALAAAGVGELNADGRTLKLDWVCASKQNWSMYSIHYRSDGNGGILIEYDQGDPWDKRDNFENAMKGQ